MEVHLDYFRTIDFLDLTVEAYFFIAIFYTTVMFIGYKYFIRKKGSNGDFEQSLENIKLVVNETTMLKKENAELKEKISDYEFKLDVNSSNSFMFQFKELDKMFKEEIKGRKLDKKKISSLEKRLETFNNEKKSYQKEIREIEKKFEDKKNISVPAVQAFYIIKNFKKYNFFANENGQVLFRPFLEKENVNSEEVTIDQEEDVEQVDRQIEHKAKKNNKPYAYLGEEIVNKIDGGETFNEPLDGGRFKLHSLHGYTIMNNGNIEKTVNYEKKDIKKKDDFVKKETYKKETLAKVEKDIENQTEQIDKSDFPKKPKVETNDKSIEELPKTQTVNINEDDIFGEIEGIIQEEENINNSFEEQPQTTKKFIYPKDIDSNSYGKLLVKNKGEELDEQSIWFTNELLVICNASERPLLFKNKKDVYLDISVLGVLVKKYIDEPMLFDKKIINKGDIVERIKIREIVEHLIETGIENNIEAPFSMTLSGRISTTSIFIDKEVLFKSDALSINNKFSGYSLLLAKAFETDELETNQKMTNARYDQYNEFKVFFASKKEYEKLDETVNS